MRILLIEDSNTDYQLLKHALDRFEEDFELVWAQSKGEAVEKLSEDNYTVVLTDLSLPDASGLDAVMAIREVDQHVPIIVLTTLSDRKIESKALAIGAQDFLNKDESTTRTLERVIRHAILRQQSVHEIMRLYNELEAKQQQLIDQKLLLSRKNRRLRKLYKTAHRFVDNVSHEFRTPLTVVKEYVSLLRDGLAGELNDEQKQLLDVASDRTTDLSNMIDDMLDISRLEAGMLGMWRRRCSLADVIPRLRSTLMNKAAVKNVSLEIHVPDDLPDVYCDDEKIGRVIINLMTNAIKFCGQPGVVRLRALYQPEERQVIVSVTDNGPGISSENYTAIFERFKQVGGNPRGSTKGFGLGLNIAKELVHLNFGEISLQSAPGDGSTFFFTIPIADPLEVLRRYLDRVTYDRSASNSVSLVVASIAPESDDGLADDTNTFLNTLLRRNDVLLPIDSHSWIIATSCDPMEMGCFLERVEESRVEINRNRLGQPLPTVSLNVTGTWKMATESEAILNAAGNVLAGDMDRFPFHIDINQTDQREVFRDVEEHCAVSR